MGYRFRDADRAPDFGGSGIGFFKSGVSITPIFPRFQEYGLVARIYPAKQDGHIMPYRFSAEEKDYTDWIRRYPVARFAGLDRNNTKSFILYDESCADEEYTDNPWYTNPYGALYYQVNREVTKLENQEASRADVNWLPLVRGRMTQRIPRPTISYFLQGYVLHLPPAKGGEKFERDANSTEVIVLQKSAGSSLVDSVEARFRTYCQDFNGYNPLQDAFDPLRFDKGCAFSWHKTSSGDFDSYGVTIHEEDITLPNGRVIPYLLSPEQVEFSQNKILPFDDVLDVPSTRDLAMMLIRMYKPILGILEFAWTQVDPHWLDDEILGMLRDRKQVTSTGIPAKTQPVLPTTSDPSSVTVTTSGDFVTSPTSSVDTVTEEVEEAPFSSDDDYARAFEEARKRANRPL